MYTFLYSNLVNFFLIIYVQHSSKLFYIKYHKIICALHGQLTSCENSLSPKKKKKNKIVAKKIENFYVPKN